ncbi:MAG: polysaccharide deacetylase family protein [Rikenellaceae bacterium]|nr:polysaccharide deacetylase family protein [Rikenellaceae bacterium]MBR2628467.1 polysaccharide deacetylase family protein [Alistipes sp.]
MNILTFDIEDWYNCDFVSENFDWSQYEVRIYDGVDRILEELGKQKLKGTFFCLGWLAENHPAVIRRIYDAGHQIGCHSYQHQLSTRFTRKQFQEDTNKAKQLLEDVIGDKVEAFRAPGFSITQNNLWAFDVLAELGFKYDSSVFPSYHDYGGMPNYGVAEPVILKTATSDIKEFPINIYKMLGRNLVFSGGGFFRLLPYPLIERLTEKSPYVMTYFHPRDFDPHQPIMEELPRLRKFKSYVGLKTAFGKFQKFLNDFEFVNIQQADQQIDWSQIRTINCDRI